MKSQQHFQRVAGHLWCSPRVRGSNSHPHAECPRLLQGHDFKNDDTWKWNLQLAILMKGLRGSLEAIGALTHRRKGNKGTCHSDAYHLMWFLVIETSMKDQRTRMGPVELPFAHNTCSTTGLFEHKLALIHNNAENDASYLLGSSQFQGTQKPQMSRNKGTNLI